MNDGRNKPESEEAKGLRILKKKWRPSPESDFTKAEPPRPKQDETAVSNPPQSALESSEVSIDDIVDFIKQLCLTYSQMAYYPAHHPVARKQIQAAWDELQATMTKLGDVSISLTEGKMLFFGMPVEDRNPAVSKFSHHFESMHIHSIKFTRGIEFREFSLFFEAFCKDHRTVEEAGGIEKILRDNNITHVAFNAAVYRVINEDEKVVSKSEVFRGEIDSVEEEDFEMVEYFVHLLLSRADDRRALLNEIKNNPDTIAGHIVKILEQIGDSEGLDRDTMVEALINNIQMITETIDNEHGADTPEELNTANAMLALEQELRRKSRNLSSGSAVRFIKRITEVVSSYTEKLKAKRVLSEFLSQEKSLRSAEKLIREIDRDTESGKRVFERVVQLMTEQGLDEKELLRRLDKADDGGGGKKKCPRKISKKFKPLADRIQNKLNADFKGINDEEKKRLISYLDTVYAREMNRVVEEKTAELRNELHHTREIVDGLDEVFSHTNIGMVIVDDEDRICFMENTDALPYKLEIEHRLPKKLTEQLIGFNQGRNLKIGDATIWEVSFDDNGHAHSILFQF